MMETFLMRFVGGPAGGETRVVEPGGPLHGWPLPDVVEGNGGEYRKVGESQLGPTPGILRGAEYQWEARGAPAG